MIFEVRPPAFACYIFFNIYLLFPLSLLLPPACHRLRLPLPLPQSVARTRRQATAQQGGRQPLVGAPDVRRRLGRAGAYGSTCAAGAAGRARCGADVIQIDGLHGRGRAPCGADRGRCIRIGILRIRRIVCDQCDATLDEIHPIRIG